MFKENIMATNGLVEVDNYTPNLSNPIRSLAGVTKGGTVTYDTIYGAGVYARWMYVGTTGSVTFNLIDGTSMTLPNMAGGVWHPVWSVSIATSGTTVAANQLFWGF